MDAEMRLTKRNAPPVTIRRARPEDKRPVRDIVRNVWGGTDYLPAVFDDWMRDRRGGLFVATIDRELAGVAKLTALSAEEGWLEGLRVAPQRRRQGVAQLLVRYRIDRARTLGLRVVRLATAKENLPVRRLVVRTGMRRVAVLVPWRARASAGKTSECATARDAPALWRLFSDSMSRASASLAKVPGKWAWREFRRHDLMKEIAMGRCVVIRISGRVSAAAIVYREGGTLVVPTVAGGLSGLRQLLARLPCEANTRGAVMVQILVPPRRFVRTLGSAGFSRGSGESWIYELRFLH